MEMKKERSVRLRTIFIQYLLLLFVLTVLLTAVLWGGLSLAMQNGFILPANYAELEIAEHKAEIASVEKVTRQMIPSICEYALYGRDGAYLSGSIPQGEAEEIWSGLQTGMHIRGGFAGTMLGARYLVPIERKDGTCVIGYSIAAEFASPALRRVLPPPEIAVSVLFLVAFLAEVLFLSGLFGRHLAKKLRGLQQATEKIQEQDLDFTVAPCGIREIDEVLHSLDQMKTALKASLFRQWGLEQERREQVSALAHDIRTPITVVRGNTDLLAETRQTEEQREYTDYIAESTGQIEKYVKALSEISRAESGFGIHRETIGSKAFMNEVRQHVEALTAVKKIRLKFETHNLPPSFDADPDLLQRALMNVATNAVDYSPENGEIDFYAEAAENGIRFRVSDYGKGFSPADLKQAAARFYMGDPSRAAKAHHGMGLFIAKSIAEQHGGTLSVANSGDTGGGMVTLSIPVHKELTPNPTESE